MEGFPQGCWRQTELHLSGIFKKCLILKAQKSRELWSALTSIRVSTHVRYTYLRGVALKQWGKWSFSAGFPYEKYHHPGGHYHYPIHTTEFFLDDMPITSIQNELRLLSLSINPGFPF